MMEDMTPINENSSNSTIVPIVNQLITNINKISNLIGQTQSSYDRNNEELLEVKKMVMEFIIKINDLPIKNEKDIEELFDKMRDISDRISIIENNFKQVNESLPPIKETVDTLNDNMDVIFDFKKDYEKCQQEVLNKRKVFWSKMWELTKPILIIIVSGAIVLLFLYLGNFLVSLGEFLKSNLLK